MILIILVYEIHHSILYHYTILSAAMLIDINILLTWGAVYKKVFAGDIIFQEGEQAYHYYQLISGRIKWVNFADDDKEYIQYIIEAGECFGELPLLDNGLYPATAIAENDSIILKLKKEHFLQLLNENPTIHFSITKMLVKRIRYKFLLTKAISNLHPENCLMDLLDYLKNENLHICPKCSQLKLTRQQIANMTGLRVETIIRSMKSLNEKKYLSIQRGKIYL